MERYGVGGEVVACHDDDVKEGGINFRPNDKLDGQVLNNITGLPNQCWEIRDSITVHDIFPGTGGKNKILHL